NAQALAEDAITRNPDLGGIWCHADNIALGAVNAVRERGKLKQTIVVGMGMFSGVPDVIKAGDGKVYTFALLPDEVGGAVGRACIMIAKGQTSQMKKITPTPLILV